MVPSTLWVPLRQFNNSFGLYLSETQLLLLVVEVLLHLLPDQVAKPVHELYPVLMLCSVWLKLNFLIKFKMSTMSRALAKAFLKSLNHFENQKEMVSRAVDPTNPTLVKSHAKNRIKLEEAFSEASYDWKNYKTDQGVDDSEFNAVEEDVPKYQYNDAWYEALKTAYFELLELDEKLDEGSPLKDDVTDAKEEKADMRSKL